MKQEILHKACCGGVISEGVCYHHTACPNVALQAGIHESGFCKCGPKGREPKCEALDKANSRD
jgi:hypothetical protein